MNTGWLYLPVLCWDYNRGEKLLNKTVKNVEAAGFSFDCFLSRTGFHLHFYKLRSVVILHVISFVNESQPTSLPLSL